MKNNRALFPFLLILIILLTACGAPSSNQPGQPGFDEGMMEPPVLYDQDGNPIDMFDQDQPRVAYLLEVEDDVTTRQNNNEEYAHAEEGLMLGEGGQAVSGANGRARFDLLPDGTIIRMGPETQFTVTELSSDPASPITRLNLFFGQIWILLNGGSIDVDTASGIAAVSGSMMSVSFDPETGDMEVTCLTGHCTLENDAGKVELVGGEASSIPGEGATPNSPYPIPEEDLKEWEEQVPESGMFEEFSQQPPPPGEGGPGEGGPGDSGFDANNSSEPITYNLTNLCYADWNWEFTGENGTYTFTVSPNGGTASGEIPGGLYQVHDWSDSGLDNTHETIGGSHFDAEYNCPNPGDENNPPPPQ